MKGAFQKKIPLTYQKDKKGCWIVASHKPGKNGYPRLTYKGKVDTASRVMYQIVNGNIPKGLFVLHTCDNRMCINPDHLYLGTFYQNMYDMVKRNRQNRGEDRPSAKLTNKNVLTIRKLLLKGISCIEIRKLFNISRQSITDIKMNRTWKHICL